MCGSQDNNGAEAEVLQSDLSRRAWTFSISVWWNGRDGEREREKAQSTTEWRPGHLPQATTGTIKQKDPEHKSKLRVSSRMCQQVCVSVCYVGSCAMCSSLNCDCMCLRVHKSHMELLIVIWHRFWEGLDVPMIALITDFHPPPL